MDTRLFAKNTKRHSLSQPSLNTLVIEKSLTIKNVISWLERKVSEGVSDVETDVAPEVKIESYCAFQELKKLTQDRHLSESDLFINEHTARPFILFFRNREQRILKTDALYFHAQTEINLLCYTLASLLSPYLKMHPYNLLMKDFPDAYSYFLAPEMPLSSFKTYECILDEKNQPIPVLQILLMGENKEKLISGEGDLIFPVSYLLCVETQVNYLKEIASSQYVQERLRNHSEPVKVFCKSVKEDPKNYPTHVLELEKAFHKFSAKITASYKDSGSEKLISEFLEKVMKLDELVKLLTEALSPADRQKFLSGVSDKELFRLCLSIEYNGAAVLSNQTKEKFMQLAENKLRQEISQCAEKIKGDDFSTLTPNYARTLLLCYAETYKRIRSTGSSYKTNVAYYLGSWLPTSAYSQTERLDALQILQKFIIYSDKLDDLDGFLKNNNLSNQSQALTASAWFGAESILSLITNITLQFGEYFKNKKIQLEDAPRNTLGR